ncbi:IS3 family transposase [Bradyrhizobium barranii]|uniref:IS3 family transposase n=1 Tax=Bradyrhizobium barranii TaxID=2992140 RepID=UPI003D15F938
MVVNHKKVRRLMREHDLQPRMRRRFTTTTDSNHDQPIFPNLAKNIVLNGPTSSGSPTSPTSPCRQLRLYCRHSGCLVPARRGLCHQPFHRRSVDTRCTFRRD